MNRTLGKRNYSPKMKKLKTEKKEDFCLKMI